MVVIDPSLCCRLEMFVLLERRSQGGGILSEFKTVWDQTSQKDSLARCYMFVSVMQRVMEVGDLKPLEVDQLMSTLVLPSPTSLHSSPLRGECSHQPHRGQPMIDSLMGHRENEPPQCTLQTKPSHMRANAQKQICKCIPIALFMYIHSIPHRHNTCAHTRMHVKWWTERGQLSNIFINNCQSHLTELTAQRQGRTTALSAT